MHTKDAAKILGLNGDITPDDVVKAYRKAAFQYHPDRNPAGEDMMKAVNAAYEVLKDFSGNVQHQADNYGEELNRMINVALDIKTRSGGSITIELMGAWLWVTGNTKPYSHLLNRKTGAGFTFASKKKAWYFRPDDYKSASRGSYSIDEIRGKYGSVEPSNTGYSRYLKQQTNSH